MSGLSKKRPYCCSIRSEFCLNPAHFLFLLGKVLFSAKMYKLEQMWVLEAHNCRIENFFGKDELPVEIIYR